MSRSARARARQHAAKVKSTEPKTQAQKDAHLVAGLLSGEIKPYKTALGLIKQAELVQGRTNGREFTPDRHSSLCLHVTVYSLETDAIGFVARVADYTSRWRLSDLGRKFVTTLGGWYRLSGADPFSVSKLVGQDILIVYDPSGSSVRGVAYVKNPDQQILWDAWPSGDEKFALTVLW